MDEENGKIYRISLRYHGGLETGGRGLNGEDVEFIEKNAGKKEFFTFTDNETKIKYMYSLEHVISIEIAEITLEELEEFRRKRNSTKNTLRLHEKE